MWSQQRSNAMVAGSSVNIGWDQVQTGQARIGKETMGCTNKLKDTHTEPNSWKCRNVSVGKLDTGPGSHTRIVVAKSYSLRLYLLHESRRTQPVQYSPRQRTWGFKVFQVWRVTVRILDAAETRLVFRSRLTALQTTNPCPPWKNYSKETRGRDASSGTDHSPYRRSFGRSRLWQRLLCPWLCRNKRSIRCSGRMRRKDHTESHSWITIQRQWFNGSDLGKAYAAKALTGRLTGLTESRSVQNILPLPYPAGSDKKNDSGIEQTIRISRKLRLSTSHHPTPQWEERGEKNRKVNLNQFVMSHTGETSKHCRR